MTIQTLTLSQIQPSVLNPRKFFNDKTIEELAQSIKTDGLLQNLVVLKPKGKAKNIILSQGNAVFVLFPILSRQVNWIRIFLSSLKSKKA